MIKHWRFLNWCVCRFSFLKIAYFDGLGVRSYCFCVATFAFIHSRWLLSVFWRAHALYLLGLLSTEVVAREKIRIGLGKKEGFCCGCEDGKSFGQDFKVSGKNIRKLGLFWMLWLGRLSRKITSFSKVPERGSGVQRYCGFCDWKLVEGWETNMVMRGSERKALRDQGEDPGFVAWGMSAC